MNIQNEKNICNFLKKLNTIDSPKEFAKLVSVEFLNITHAHASCVCLLSGTSNKIDIKQLAYQAGKKQNMSLKHAIEKISIVGDDLLTNSFETEDILDYFNSISKEGIIIEPIYYKNTILGYAAMVHKNRSFYKRHKIIVEILMESVNSRLEIISLKEELNKTNREKVQFLASISHEYKTPLNSIIGFSDILKSKMLNDENYKYIDNISKGSKFSLSLIQDILDMARCEYKPMEIKCEDFQPKEVIEDILWSFNEAMNEKNINISYTLMDVEIYADLKRFKQLIYNLVSNSVKYNKIGGKVTIVTYINENQEFTFEIKDSGDGIRKKDYGKIFNFFSQVNRDQLKRQQGSGVGLALCKAIAKAHGGDIGFKSRLNFGSTFWFTIPKAPERETDFIEF